MNQCINCHREIPEGQTLCPACRRQQTLQQLEERDPEFAALDNRYIQAGVLRYVFGVMAAVFVALMKWSLDGTFSDGVGMFSMVAAPVCLLVWLSQCIRRGVLKKKLLRRLESAGVELP